MFIKFFKGSPSFFSFGNFIYAKFPRLPYMWSHNLQIPWTQTHYGRKSFHTAYVAFSISSTSSITVCYDSYINILFMWTTATLSFTISFGLSLIFILHLYYSTKTTTIIAFFMSVWWSNRVLTIRAWWQVKSEFLIFYTYSKVQSIPWLDWDVCKFYHIKLGPLFRTCPPTILENWTKT